jgi:hypothetical protein
MLDLPLPESREDALTWMAASSVTGYLGLFVGTGFSKAATAGRAPGFEELLMQVAERLKLTSDFDGTLRFRRKSLPQIASLLLDEYAAVSSSAGRASDDFRQEISHTCNLAPDAAIAARLRAAFGLILPAWFITTNYDLILESLAEDAVSVLPTEPLVPLALRPPIYHIHGHRHVPSSIRITEEDYVGLLGPIDYQRLKLPLLLYESATLMLGYALGDINVRAAIGWSRSFRGDQSPKLRSWQGRVFHAVRKVEPNPKPYFGPDGEIVLEISDVVELLEELGKQRGLVEGVLGSIRTSIQSFLADPQNAAIVASDRAKREEFLSIIEKSLMYCQPTMMIDFLSRALDPIWAKARRDSGFEFYDTYLRLLIDLLARIRIRSVNPVIVFYLGDALDRVGWYLDKAKPFGSAHAATDTWLAEHKQINDEVKHELNSYAVAYEKHGLIRALQYAGLAPE